MKIGAQLYTVRDKCKTIEGLYNTLEEVKKIGYNYVQLSGVCAYDPEDMRKKLDSLGLKCTLTHTDVNRMVNETEAVVNEHRIFGCKNIGIGGMPAEYRGSSDGAARFAEKYLPAALKMREMGATMMYHNHHFEFKKYDGKCVLKDIAERFPADALGFTLDTYWVQAGGGDCLEWLDILKGRIECIHLKDMVYGETGAVYAPIYEGNMNFDKIIPFAAECGAKYAFVEQDDTFGLDTLEALKISFDNVTKRFPEMA